VDLVPEEYQSLGFVNLAEDKKAQGKRLMLLLESPDIDDCSICLVSVPILLADCRSHMRRAVACGLCVFRFSVTAT